MAACFLLQFILKERQEERSWELGHLLSSVTTQGRAEMKRSLELHCQEEEVSELVWLHLKISWEYYTHGYPLPTGTDIKHGHVL